MDFNEHAKEQYEELKRIKADLENEVKTKKARIDKEAKEKRSKINAKLSALNKYLIIVGVNKKKTKTKK